MPADLQDQARELDKATQQLLETAERLHPGGTEEDSLLPGWSRGHVLTHLARNADGMRNLLTWARTGRPTPMYASARHRAEDIEAGAGRPPGVVLADLRESAGLLASDIDAMPHAAWSQEVRFLDGEAFPAERLLWVRLKEVEIHHLDLAAGRTPDDWPTEFAQRALTETVGSFSGREDGWAVHLFDVDTGAHHLVGHPTMATPRIHGTAGHLLVWLIGRGAVADVSTDSGLLPTPPAWS
ncbi:maleylpyruvate isomerase family mycothiol-dependent enzyme [Streptomyces cavernicola]|uniref:Maleylpyruvate isomerase family mycothiol-dependent enzyme n=1 Tax=Streptomyces cavernicola TaxID=3043613 RepID=A0ABT6SG82_9ACTN|nr:maleylpyruvate isomerase family mycothiol-dependent enzyme [Streptomyces sp. B-S-A6]MDI3406433.1 maleylpyruvate isomerase family mycothiol-dependent enzyme [Streptomyces sp. B-S-A6]